MSTRYNGQRGRTECPIVNNNNNTLFSFSFLACSFVLVGFKTSLPEVIWEEGRIAALLHNYVLKSSPDWLQWRAPNSSSKVPLPVDPSPNRSTCLISGPVRLMIPNGIRIRLPF